MTLQQSVGQQPNALPMTQRQVIQFFAFSLQSPPISDEQLPANGSSGSGIAQSYASVRQLFAKTVVSQQRGAASCWQ